MGDKENRSADEYGKRDEEIMAQLRSSVVAVRDEGWERVERNYKKPLASTLRRIARRSASAAYEAILSWNLQLDAAVFDEIWQDTKKCLYENIQKPGFEFKGKLLAYLVRIALRRMVKRWRQERRHQHVVDLDRLVDTLSVAPDELTKLVEKDGLLSLLKDIKQFHDTLKKEDQLVLLLGMRLATDGHSRKTSGEIFAEKIRQTGAWCGSDATIARRYARLRESLRKFLKHRGHNV